MVDEFLLNWLNVTSAALPDIHHVCGSLSLGLAIVVVFAIPLACTTALRKRRLALAGIVAWQLLFLASLLLIPDPLFAPLFALPFFLLRGRVSLKLCWRDALTFAVYLSVASLAASFVAWLSFGLLLAY